MASSKLKLEKRSKLFFNKFKYKASLHITGAAYTYYTNDIDMFIERMEKLRDNNTKRFGVRYIDDSWKEFWEEVNIDKISKFITWRNIVNKEKCMYRIQGDYVSFFSNDLDLLETLKSIDSKLTLVEVQTFDVPDTMFFKKEPKFKRRTYFRSKRMPKDFSDNVRSLQSMYPGLNFSKAIFTSLFHNNWHPFRYMHGSYFVEYNDEQMLTILSMWFPDMLGKTYTLAKEP